MVEARGKEKTGDEGVAVGSSHSLERWETPWRFGAGKTVLCPPTRCCCLFSAGSMYSREGYLDIKDALAYPGSAILNTTVAIGI